MEKRNFVTSARTPMDGAADIDDIIEAGAESFGSGEKRASDGSFERKASEEDEETDKAV